MENGRNLYINIKKAIEAAGIIVIIADLGGITAILSVTVKVVEITAGGIANQIN